MDNENKQTKINFYTNIITLIVNILVALYYTPFLVNTLGIIAYGVLPLALIINQYISVLTTTLTSSFSRFYTVALHKDDYLEASKIISTSLCVIIGIIIILLIPLIVVISNINILFNIPTNIINSAKLLFILTTCSFFISLLTSVINVTLFALNRLDILNYLKIIRNALKLLFVILLFNICSVDIVYVGLSNFICEIIIFFISISLFQKFKNCKIKICISFIDKMTLCAIFSMSSWVLIQQLGDTLIYKTDILFINNHLGTEASGRLGAISELGSYIVVIVNVIGTLFGPLIMAEYAKGNHEKVKKLGFSQTKIVGMISAVLCGILAGLGSAILTIWLGVAFADYHHWLILKIFPIPFVAAGGVLAYIYRAWNKVMFTAICTVFLGLACLILLIILTNFSKFFIAELTLTICMIFTILQSYVLNAISVNKIYKGNWIILIKNAFFILLSFVISFTLCYGVNEIVEINNVLSLILLGIVIGIVVFLFEFFVIFNKEEKKGLLSIIK